MQGRQSRFVWLLFMLGLVANLGLLAPAQVVQAAVPLINELRTL